MTPLTELFFGSLVLLAAVTAFFVMAFSAEECFRALRSLVVPSGREEDPAAWPRPVRRVRGLDAYSAAPLWRRLDAICRRAAALRAAYGEEGGAGALPGLLPAPGGGSPGEAPEARLYPFRAPERPPEAPVPSPAPPAARTALQGAVRGAPGPPGRRPRGKGERP